MIEVKELKDNSFEISWDKNDPVENMMNNWTEQDFMDAITKYLNQLEKGDSLESGTQTSHSPTNTL